MFIDEGAKMTDTDNTYNNIEELLPRFCEGMTTAAESRYGTEWNTAKACFAGRNRSRN